MFRLWVRQHMILSSKSNMHCIWKLWIVKTLNGRLYTLTSKKTLMIEGKGSKSSSDIQSRTKKPASFPIKPILTKQNRERPNPTTPPKPKHNLHFVDNLQKPSQIRRSINLNSILYMHLPVLAFLYASCLFSSSTSSSTPSSYIFLWFSCFDLACCWFLKTCEKINFIHYFV